MARTTQGDRSRARYAPFMRFLISLRAWLAATIVAAAAGSIVQTQFNLAAIEGLGAPVPPGLRLQTTLHDLTGFAPLLAGVTATGFLVAFPVAALIAGRWPRARTVLYTLAGGVAVGTAILVMNAALPVTAIGATRSIMGLLALSTMGALGGRVFAALLPRRDSRGMA